MYTLLIIAGALLISTMPFAVKNLIKSSSPRLKDNEGRKYFKWFALWLALGIVLVIIVGTIPSIAIAKDTFDCELVYQFDDVDIYYEKLFKMSSFFHFRNG